MASTALTSDTKAKLDELGPVKCVLALFHKSSCTRNHTTCREGTSSARTPCTRSSCVSPPAVYLAFAHPRAGEFKTAYPQAKLIGVEPYLHKKSLADLKFDGGQPARPCGHNAA